MKITKVGVAGAGAMGAGIAQVCAAAGLEVILFDITENQLLKAKTQITENLEVAVVKNKISETEKNRIGARINFTRDINLLQADFIIEAIVEKTAPKVELFQQLAAINPAETIFATNTSSISVTRIAKDIPNPGRVVGMHFFNPVHLMKLVEIISGAETSAQVANQTRELAVALGKSPITCSDSPGFIVNRVARPYYVESLQMLEEKVATPKTIDTLMESAGFKMGPFKLMDHVGNDINFAVTSSLYHSFHGEAKFRPSRIQEQKVDAGNFGKKTGKGFYDYK